MTAKTIEKELSHFDKMDYVLQYWCVENFLKEHIASADYFIELIKNFKETIDK